MSQQITITIPDALAERLKAVKQRFNVSGVCQNALEREVTNQEYAMKEPKDMEQFMKKLRAQKQESIKAMQTRGREDGLEAATNMDYDDFRTVEKVVEPGEAVVQNLMACALWGDWLEECVSDAENTASEDGVTFDQEAYLEGWVDGVMDFWRKIKDKL